MTLKLGESNHPPSKNPVQPDQAVDADHKNSALIALSPDTAPLSSNFTNNSGSWGSHNSILNENWDDFSISPLFDDPALSSQIPPASEDGGLVSNLAGIGSEVRLEQDSQMVAYNGSCLDGLDAFQLGTEGQFNLPLAGANSSAIDAQFSSLTRGPTQFSWTDILIDGWNDESRHYTVENPAVREPQQASGSSIGTDNVSQTGPVPVPEPNSTIDPRILAEFHESANHELQRGVAEEDSTWRILGYIIGNQTHLATRLGDDEDKIHSCSNCSKSFDLRCKLTKHEKSHTKPIKCLLSECDYACTSELDLMRHYNSKHTADDEKNLFPVKNSIVKAPSVGGTIC
ncbi:hypothetical protein L207DRAFT_522600 [Hyaloscypha variabilis F]|uniref:C2H2-type domain-containing protein n=1 Tax=Hyaloscypha variabilis (strain UAMH 11265 / GT02V1 / F) TaxID=1149755 RepID=A0A2J6S8R9_HYAVF|nr:hypothetical protein L207DRAFT_522600 [Hyaloscypha variabilis F]